MLSFSMKRFFIMQVCPDDTSGQVVTGSISVADDFPRYCLVFFWSSSKFTLTIVPLPTD